MAKSVGNKSPSGYFFEIDGKQFGKTYAELVLMSRAILSDARALAYWADEQGGGRFTPLAAALCVSFIKQTIDGKHPEVTSGFKKNQSEGSIRYNKMKETLGAGNNHWRFTGSVQESITYRVEKLGKKSMGVVHIDPNIETPQIRLGRGLEFRGWVKAADVVQGLEFGTRNMPARPLISSAIRRFVSVNFPKMTDAVEKSVLSWAKHSTDTYRNPSDKADVRDFMGAATRGESPETTVDRDPEDDFGEEKVNDALARGDLGGINQRNSAQLNEMDREMVQVMKQSGMPQEEIDAFMKTWKSK